MTSRHSHATGTDKERDLAFALIEKRHHAMVSAILDIPNVGFASVKLENDLAAAKAFGCNLEHFGLGRGPRRRAVGQIAEIAGKVSAGQVVLAGAEAIAENLRLLHLPVSGLGMDITAQSVRAFKGYCRTDKADERLEDGDIKSSFPTIEQEIGVSVALAEAICPSSTLETLRILKGMQSAGSALDGFGIDIDQDGAVELKLYMIPRVDSGRGQRPFSIEESSRTIQAALDLCGLQRHLPGAQGFVAILSALDLPCSHVAIDVRPSGEREIKVYFDTWGVGLDGPSPIREPFTAKRAISGAYLAANTPFDGPSMNKLIDRIYAGGMIIDSVAVDFGSAGAAAKTYLRSAADEGHGVVLPRMGAVS